MSVARTFQTARNTLQATRINAASQVRGIFGGMGLAENGNGNNTTPPANGDGFSGPMGMWPFPIINMIQSRGMGGNAAPSDVGRLGVPSNAAHVTAEAGMDRVQRQGGMHIW